MLVAEGKYRESLIGGLHAPLMALNAEGVTREGRWEASVSREQPPDSYEENWEFKPAIIRYWILPTT